jgi:hypothetical protein
MRTGSRARRVARGALVVLETAGGSIAAIRSFLDVGTLFPRFGLPLELPRENPDADR